MLIEQRRSSDPENKPVDGDIQDFYTEQLKRVKASSVIHYHANIHKALRYAFKTDLIPQNPADKIERPKKERFTGSFYDSEEITELFEAAYPIRCFLRIASQ